MAIQQIAGFLTPYAYEDITVNNTAGGVGLTSTVLMPTSTVADRDMGRSRFVFITCENADVRYSMVSGTAPVAGGPGHLLPNGSSLIFVNLQAAKNFRAIRDTSVNAVLRVSYFR